MSRLFRTTRRGAQLLLACVFVYFVAMKLGWVAPYGELLSVAVVALCLWLLGELVAAAVGLARHRIGLIAFLGRALVVCGCLLVFAGGLANWLYRLEGFVLMAEGEKAPFFQSRHLQDFDGGWLSDVKEMDLTLELDKVALEGSDGNLLPVSTLTLLRKGAAPHHFRLSPGEQVEDGSLRFHHGAFGYAPRIVITKGTKTIFDETVPFTTRGDDGVMDFVSEFTIAKHELRVNGAVALDSLDEQGRGHPSLAVSVQHRGKAIGKGLLRIGHFAGLGSDLRIGFAGLAKWAEIDISRRNYPQPMFAGAALVALGVLILAISLSLRSWRSA